MRRLLLISYYFPPSGGPGVQRTLKFVKYLREFGWDPTVLTVEPRYAAYPSHDPSLERDIPEEVEVVRTRSWDPYGAYAALTGRRKSETVSVSFSGEGRPNLRQRLGRWFRGNVFLPDARVGWVPFALRAASRLLDSGSFDAMMTTGPPHSTHLVGLRLSRTFNVPWLADFRDPWTAIDFSHLLPSTRVARQFDAWMERRVLSCADRVTIVSRHCADHLVSRYRRSYDVLMNGFDDADFPGTVFRPSGGFVVAHVGSMDLSRDPETLWRALEGTQTDSTATVRLIGRVDPGILESADCHGVAGRIEILQQVDHAEAIRRMCNSSLLLVVINRSKLARGIVPGKVFEYVGAGRPVLGIGPTDGDAANVLSESGAGQMFDYDDVAGVMECLKQHESAWNCGTPLEGAGVEAARRFSRRNRTRQLASLLDELVDTREAR